MGTVYKSWEGQKGSPLNLAWGHQRA